MQALLQPQQWMLTPQQGPDATAATAAAAAHCQTYAVSYPYYVMPGAAGFPGHALPLNPMGLLPSSAGLPAQWDPTQQVMLQGPNAMLGIAGMQLTPDVYPGMYPVMTGAASAGQQQQQQLWGQQVHSMPQGVPLCGLRLHLTSGWPQDSLCYHILSVALWGPTSSRCWQGTKHDILRIVCGAAPRREGSESPGTGGWVWWGHL